MLATAIHVAAAAGLGGMAGLLGGLFGVGGGFLVIPLLGFLYGMDQQTARSLINSNVSTGVTFSIKHPDASTEDITLKDGPIYPAIDEELTVE